jgi:UDP-N-acetyl-D-galactosamine dehydrogenase
MNVPSNPLPNSLKISIIGLGYVGLPLAVALAKKFDVTGFDINETRVRELKNHHDRTWEIDDERLKASSLRVTHKIDDIKSQDIYIVTVPTPVDHRNEPDLTSVLKASEMVGKAMKKGAIVVFESTVYPGVTEDLCGPALERASNLVCGKDFFLGYSPERINPGDKEHTVDRITKVVAGQTPEVAKLLGEVYGATNNNNIHLATNIKTAEAAKVIENAQRDINIAFMNEITLIFKKLGISIHDVLEAAQTKWNFLPFQPGLVGGHCIGVDPFYLAHCSKEMGHNPEIILSGRRINDAMGFVIADYIAEELKAILSYGSKARILIMGFTFKENVPDLRNTKVYDLVSGLSSRGHNVDVYDPHADREEALKYYNLPLIENLDEIDPYDCVVGAVPHKEFKEFTTKYLGQLVKQGGIVADLKGIWRGTEMPAKIRTWHL